MQFLYRIGAISLVKVNDALASPLAVFEPTRAMAKPKASKIRPAFFIGDSADVDTALLGIRQAKLCRCGLVPLDGEILWVRRSQVNGQPDRNSVPGEDIGNLHTNLEQCGGGSPL